MARSRLLRTERWAYHVSVRSNNKEWFYIPIEQVWEICSLYLDRISDRYGTEIHLFLLMSNHFHLIISAPGGNLDAAMRFFLTEVSREIRKRSGRINHVFGGRYKWSVLDSAYALAYVYKYVCRNPVRAGICERVEQYPFSTFTQGLSGRLTVPIVEGFDPYWSLIPTYLMKKLEWLNKPVPGDTEKLVGKALRRAHFQFTKDKGFSRRLRALSEAYEIEIP